MSTFKRFENINAWQKARELANLLHTVTNTGKLRSDYSLKEQLNRAGLSIMLNIAEGFGRRSNKEFINFLVMSHGSASEIQSAMYAAKDRKYVEKNTFDTFIPDVKKFPR